MGWCENKIIVEGKASEIDRFLRKNRGFKVNYTNQDQEKEELSEFTFNALVPVPEEIRQFGYNCCTFDKIDGYVWQSLNWGCESDACDVDIERTSPTEAVIRFSTSTFMPEIWTLKVASLFPKLKIIHIFLLFDFTVAIKNEYRNGGLVFVTEAMNKKGVDEIIHEHFYHEMNDDN